MTIYYRQCTFKSEDSITTAWIVEKSAKKGKRMVFKDMLSKGKGTEYIIESIDFDTEIPAHLLTKAALRK